MPHNNVHNRKKQAKPLLRPQATCKATKQEHQNQVTFQNASDILTRSSEVNSFRCRKVESRKLTLFKKPVCLLFCFSTLWNNTRINDNIGHHV